MMAHQSETIECPVALNARTIPDKTALVDEGSSLTYGELERRIAECADRLGALGIKENERAAILAANSVDYAVLIHTLCRVGVTAMPLNLRWKSDEWRKCVEQAGCSMVFVDGERKQAAVDMKIPWSVIGETSSGKESTSKKQSSSIAPRDSINAEAEATIIFTSGSTGKPRGVILTFGNHHYNALGSNSNLPLEADDCWLAVLPFYHVGGQAILFRSAIAGSSVHILDDFDAAEINKLIDDGKLTHASLVPTMLKRLIEERGSRAFPARLKAILLGGAPIPEALTSNCADLSIPVFATYGLTETASQVATSPSYSPPDGPRPRGKPLEYSEIRIVDSRGQDAEEGVEGEIAVRGKVLFKGYLDESPDETFDPEGWFHTGDMGTMDSDGYLRVTGRKDDMFISGGENIHLSSIEKAVSRSPDVIESAAIAVEDEKWGHRPVLFVCLEVAETGRAASRDEVKSLLHFLIDKLSPIQVPERIVVMDRLPRTAIGKVDKVELREIYRNADA